MTSHTPQAHARFAPSSAERRFKCPGSIALEAPFPDQSNDYTDRGTAIHEVGAWCLDAPDKNLALSRVGELIVVSHANEKPVREVLFTQEMAELAQDYADYVMHQLTIAAPAVLHVEQRVEFSKFVAMANQFGTSDATIVKEAAGELMVIDLKTGHQQIHPENNAQLMTYALAMLGKLYEQAQAEAQPQPEEAGNDDEPMW